MTWFLRRGAARAKAGEGRGREETLPAGGARAARWVADKAAILLVKGQPCQLLGLDRE